MGPNMTEIGLIKNNEKKTNKISQISYFFRTLFLVHRKVRCPPKVSPNPTSIHIYKSIHVKFAKSSLNLKKEHTSYYI